MRILLVILLVISISFAWVFYPLVKKPQPWPSSIITSNQYLTNGYTITWVTNGSTLTNPPVVETDYQQGFRVGHEIGFKDGVFWGSFACFRGNPTNMLDAETIAYHMRRESIRHLENHERGMTNQ